MGNILDLIEINTYGLAKMKENNSEIVIEYAMLVNIILKKRTITTD